MINISSIANSKRQSLTLVCQAYSSSADCQCRIAIKYRTPQAKTLMAPRLQHGPPSISHIHRNIWCSTCIINTTISDYGLNLWRLCDTTRFAREIFKRIHKQITLLRKNAQEMQVIGKTKSTLQERAGNDLVREFVEVIVQGQCLPCRKNIF